MKKTEKKIHGLLIAILALLTFQRCYYDNEAELYPSSGECVSTDMSYMEDIKPILDQHCNSCHNAATRSGNVILDSYEEVSRQAGNGNLLGVIKHEPGFPPMPQDQPQLSDCKIAKIESWIADGSPDN